MMRLIAILLASSTVVTMAHGNPAQVQDLGQFSAGLATEGDAFAVFITVLCFVLAFCLAVLGVVKLNAAQDPRSNVSSWVGFVWLFLATLMAALPATINLGVGSIFGESAETLSGGGRSSLLDYK